MPRISDLMPQLAAYAIFIALGFILRILVGPDVKALSELEAGEAILVVRAAERPQEAISVMDKSMNKEKAKDIGRPELALAGGSGRGSASLLVDVKGAPCIIAVKTKDAQEIDGKLLLRVDIKKFADQLLPGIGFTGTRIVHGEQVLPPCRLGQKIKYGFR